MPKGKIARLPRDVRNQVSRRLDDGEEGDTLLEWLNGLPEVKELCAEQFQSVPVSKQNLSEFKQGAHQAWVRSREACELVEHLAEQADDLGNTTEELNVSDVLGRVLAVELARMAQTVLAEVTDPQERWRRLQEVLGRLAELRVGDHKWQRVQIARERWEVEQERLEQEEGEKRIAKAKQQATAPIFARMLQGPMAEAFGGGEQGRKIAELITAIQYELPMPAPSRRASASAKATVDGSTSAKASSGAEPTEDGTEDGSATGPADKPAPDAPRSSSTVKDSQG
jgi:hypothetical protein